MNKEKRGRLNLQKFRDASGKEITIITSVDALTLEEINSIREKVTNEELKIPKDS